MHDTKALEAFHWETQPVAERLVLRLVSDFIANCSAAQNLADRMRHQTGTRFQDWIDDLALQRTDALVGELTHAGFVVDQFGAYAHPGGIFPRVRLHDEAISRLT